MFHRQRADLSLKKMWINDIGISHPLFRNDLPFLPCHMQLEYYLGQILDFKFALMVYISANCGLFKIYWGLHSNCIINSVVWHQLNPF